VQAGDDVLSQLAQRRGAVIEVVQGFDGLGGELFRLRAGGVKAEQREISGLVGAAIGALRLA